jgi:hypothetical protein
MVLICVRCGRALGPGGDKSHHLKPPDPDPDLSAIFAQDPGNCSIPLLPPFLQRQVEEEAERQMAAEREEAARVAAAATASGGDMEVSRASTPSID